MNAEQKLRKLLTAADEVDAKIVANEAGLQITVPLGNFGDVKVIEEDELPEAVKESIRQKTKGCEDCS